MSTQNTQQVKMNAACRELLNERLDVSLGPTVDLDQLATRLAADRLDLPEIRSMVTSFELGGALSQLAPEPFAAAQMALNTPATSSTMPTVVAAASSALANAVAVAGAVLASATRDLTVEAYTGAAAELGYTSSTCRGTSATGIELWRDNELLLLRVHDGGAVEADHAGLVDSTCGDRQRELDAAVERRGITFTGRKQYNHGALAGGSLITAAVARRDPILARATVADAEQPPGRQAQRGRSLSGGQAEPSHRVRERRLGGTA